jgi:hypothetical protein
MSDPLTLSFLGAAALTQGIKFLFDQATELLRRRREARAAGEDRVETTSVEPPTTDGSQLLDGELARRPIAAGVLEQNLAMLQGLRRDLGDYADGLADVEPSDLDLLRKVEALRGLLEAVYGQRITFTGEPRPTTGTPVNQAAASSAVAAAERAVAVGRDNIGTIITGDVGEASGVVHRPRSEPPGSPDERSSR